MDLEFKTISHFRELGGMKTEDGRTVRHGYFYRCGELAGASQAEQQKIDALNIGTVFDFFQKLWYNCIVP